MTFRFKILSTTAFFIAFSASAQADPTAVSSVFATGGPVGGTGPNSVTIGDGSVWIEYGNAANSTGAGGTSTIVQYGLKRRDRAYLDDLRPRRWAEVQRDHWDSVGAAEQRRQCNALDHQPNDACGVGPIVLWPALHLWTPGGGNGRGYDDVAFLGGNVYLSYTNPSIPADPVLQNPQQRQHPIGNADHDQHPHGRGDRHFRARHR